jgi:hypothetical protein
MMAHVRSTTHPRDDDTVAEGEGATDRTKLIQASDTDSHSRAGGDCDEGSHSWSYYFRPLMITISRIREMINREYFAEGIACVPREETIPELNGDEVIVFEKLFIAGLMMPPPLVLSDIL